MDLGDRWREGEQHVGAPGISPVLEAQHGVRRSSGVGVDLRPGALADVDDGEPGAAAEALVGAGHEDVGVDILGVNVHPTEGGDRVHDGQHVVVTANRADLVHRVDRARRRVVMADREDANVRPGLQHVADRVRIDGVVVGRHDLDQLPAMTRRPEAEALAVFAGGEVQHHVVGANQSGGGGFEPQHRFAVQDHRRQRGAQRLGGLPDGQFVEFLEGRIEVVGHRPRERPQDRGIRVDWPCAQRDDRGSSSKFRIFGAGSRPWTRPQDTSPDCLPQGGAWCNYRHRGWSKFRSRRHDGGL